MVVCTHDLSNLEVQVRGARMQDDLRLQAEDSLGSMKLSYKNKCVKMKFKLHCL